MFLNVLLFINMFIEIITRHEKKMDKVSKINNDNLLKISYMII